MPHRLLVVVIINSLDVRRCKLGRFSSHGGNAKENATLKMTSKYFKLLRDSFNLFNLSNVAKQSES